MLSLEHRNGEKSREDEYRAERKVYLKSVRSKMWYSMCVEGMSYDGLLVREGS